MWQMARANTSGPQRAITIKVIYLISVSAVLMFALTHDCIAHCMQHPTIVLSIVLQSL